VIRIVGVQRSSTPEKEFNLLQNQGSLRAKLRGHIVAADAAFEQSNLNLGSFAFGDEMQIPPGMFVILFSGSGEARWAKTKEGQMIYYCYMGRESSVWEHISGSIHVLSTQHTFAERPPALLLK
jgi:hypothetical protein